MYVWRAAHAQSLFSSMVMMLGSAIEGEGTNYKRETIQVRRQNGDIATALTYSVTDPKPGLKTNIDYVGHIIRGLRDHKVPDEYIAKVKAIAVANNPRHHKRGTRSIRTED